MKKLLLIVTLLIAILTAISCITPVSTPTTSTLPTTTIPTTSPPTTTTTKTIPTTTPQSTTDYSPTPTSTTPAGTTIQTSELPSSELTVHFIDVGQGDAILIDLDETEILIDGGDKSPGVVSYLNDYVDGELEIMVATHPHADHIGGLISVLDTFQVEQIWHNGDESSSLTYTEFMAAVQSEGAEVHVARRGDSINTGELTFTVLNPLTLSGTTNNNSIVLSLSYGGIDFLFTGDAEQEAEADMLVSSTISLPDVEILKVGHHGSRTASSPDFLAAISPETAIYMAGEGNSYGHPHEETILALFNIGADIYGTDVCGTIVVTTDGKTYEVQTERECIVQTPPPQTTTAAPPTTTTSPPSTKTTTPPATTTTTPPLDNDVKITYIFYDGVVPTVESDEYVEITNLGTASVNLQGWRLVDIDEGYPEFVFPSYLLEPGKSIRVYTNEIHLEYGGFSFGYGKAIWNNADPDVAVLYDAQGNEVSRRSY
jgi:competence protein ComEC